MAVLASKSEPRCKLCRHTRRNEIDALLEKRSNAESDEQGRRFNESYVLEILASWGVENPTPDNIKGHWKNHCEVITSETLEATQHAAIQKARELIEGGEHVDVDENLRWLVTVGRAEVVERIARGEKSGITIDHVLKATAELTRRDHNLTQEKLLGELVGGIGQALAAPREPKQIEGAEVIDQEPVEEAEFVPVES